jgi:hypothetical protein
VPLPLLLLLLVLQHMLLTTPPQLMMPFFVCFRCRVQLLFAAMDRCLEQHRPQQQQQQQGRWQMAASAPSAG